MDQNTANYLVDAPVKEFGHLQEEEIVRKLIAQWLDYYRSDCQDPAYKLSRYSAKIMKLDQPSQGYEIVALVQYEVLPVRSYTPDYKGNLPPNQWVFTSTTILPDGIQRSSSWFGVVRDSGRYKIRYLPGWGT